MASALYAGVITDSGGFKYPRTDSELLRIAANLVDAGADPILINEKVYNVQSFGSLKLLGKGLNSLDTYYDGKLAFMSLEKNDFKESGLTLADTEGFTSYPTSLEGVIIGILLIDNPFVDSEIKISFRSKGEYSVRNYCRGIRRRRTFKRFRRKSSKQKLRNCQTRNNRKMRQIFC